MILGKIWIFFFTIYTTIEEEKEEEEEAVDERKRFLCILVSVSQLMDRKHDQLLSNNVATE